MTEETLQMKPIWFFVGWVLMVIGTIVLTAGIYRLFNPISFHVELPGLHIDIWWGAILIIGGWVLRFFNKKPIEL